MHSSLLVEVVKNLGYAGRARILGSVVFERHDLGIEGRVRVDLGKLSRSSLVQVLMMRTWAGRWMKQLMRRDVHHVPLAIRKKRKRRTPVTTHDYGKHVYTDVSYARLCLQREGTSATASFGVAQLGKRRSLTGTFNSRKVAYPSHDFIKWHK